MFKKLTSAIRLEKSIISFPNSSLILNVKASFDSKLLKDSSSIKVSGKNFSLFVPIIVYK
jgi:hypothetical protein